LGCTSATGIVYGRNDPAYSVTNYSEDISRLFCEACDLLGIHWCRANRVIVSIARRPDVARLDALRAEPSAF